MNEGGKSAAMEKVVCVTGASGYIASWLVKLLLNHGYTVHATVRNPDDQTKVEHLFNLEGAKERLHLFKADLMEEGSFDSVVYTGQLRALEVVVDESWFSDPELCKESSMMWYTISKTLAEDAAWKFAKENNIDMISINPGMVIGPMLQTSLATSVALILNLINGANTYPNATFGWVHVKDVATAHILAFEVQSASGRHILVESVSHCSEIVKILQELCPALTLPDKCADDKPFVPSYQVSKVKAKGLGINFTPLNVSLYETVENLKAKGFVRF